MDSADQTQRPGWADVSAALDRAQDAADELATNDVEKVQRRFGVVIARMEIKRLFKEGETDGC